MGWSWFTSKNHSEKGHEEAPNWETYCTKKNDAPASLSNDATSFDIQDIHFFQDHEIEKSLSGDISEKVKINKKYSTRLVLDSSYHDQVNALARENVLKVAPLGTGGTLEVSIVSSNTDLSRNGKAAEILQSLTPPELNTLIKRMFGFHLEATVEPVFQEMGSHSPAKETVSDSPEGREKIIVINERSVKIEKRLESARLQFVPATLNSDERDRLLGIFKDSKDGSRLAEILSGKGRSYLLPEYLMKLKNHWESVIDIDNEGFRKQFGPQMADLNLQLEKYCNIASRFTCVDNLREEAKSRRTASTRKIYFLLITLMLICVEIPINLDIFEKTVGDKHEVVVWATVLLFGIFIVGAGEGLAYLGGSRADRTQRGFTIAILIAVPLFILTTGFMRYYYAAHEAEVIMAQENEESFDGNQKQAPIDKTKLIFTATMMTIGSAGIFVLAWLVALWNRYGSLRHIFLQLSWDKLEEKVSKRLSLLEGMWRSHEQMLESLVNSGQLEMNEFVEGFAGRFPEIISKHRDDEKVAKQTEFNGLLDYFKTARAGSVRIGPGRMLTKDGRENTSGSYEHVVSDFTSAKERHLITKAKTVATLCGFEDGFSGKTCNPENLKGVAGFEVDKALRETHWDDFAQAYKNGHATGQIIHNKP